MTEPTANGGGSGRVQRLRGRVSAVQRSTQRRVDASRATSPTVDAAFVIQDRDRVVAGNLLACAIAYRLFLWFLPLALAVAAALGFAQSAGGGEPEQLGRDVGLGKSVVKVVSDAAEQAEQSRWIILVLALFGLYSAGTGAAKTFTAAHGLVWGMPTRQPAKSAKASALFTGVTLATLALAIGANWLRRESPGFGLTVTIAVAVLFAGVWLGISCFLPHSDAPWTRLIPGALFLGAGTQLLHLVTVYYLSGKIESASELYGGLGVAATLLLGLYLLARLMIAAAVINATLWERTNATRRDVAGAPPVAGRPDPLPDEGPGDHSDGVRQPVPGRRTM